MEEFRVAAGQLLLLRKLASSDRAGRLAHYALVLVFRRFGHISRASRAHQRIDCLLNPYLSLKSIARARRRGNIRDRNADDDYDRGCGEFSIVG